MKIKEKKELNIITDLLIMLCVLAILTIYYYGSRAAIILSISIVTCTIADFASCMLRKKGLTHESFLSAIVTGLILALMMSASVPYYLVVISALFAIIIGKHAFGGHGSEIFSSAAVGFLFVTLSFPDGMLLYPKPFDELPITSSIPVENLHQSLNKQLINTELPSVDYMDLLIGKFCSPMGTTFFILIVVCAVILMFRRSISAIAFFTELAVVSAFSFIFYDYNVLSLFNFLGGGMMLFGMIFLACDFRTIPKTRSSRFLYGLILGALILIFEFIAKVDNAVVYAVIIAAPIGIELDKKALSFAEILNDKNSGLIVKLRRKINKPALNVNETLKMIERGNDSEQRTEDK